MIVGNSMGGFVAAELALSFATRVERLVLVKRRRALDRGVPPRADAGGARVWAADGGRAGARCARGHAAAGAAARGCS